MKKTNLFTLFYRSMNSNITHTLNANNSKIYWVRYCSTSLNTEHVAQLGDFSRDLKPYLRFKKKTCYNNFLRDHYANEHPIIKCKNPKLNFYKGQTYDKYSPIPLASQNWKGHKSVGDYFAIKVHPDGYFGKYGDLRKGFDEVNLNQYIIDVLKENDIKHMSQIQELAIPEILNGHNCLLAAETGCGKTLAFLLPIIQQILEWKKVEKDRPFNTPYVLIITPNRELTEQIRGVIRLFEKLDIGSQKIVGGSVRKKLANPVVTQTDILVTTPIVVQKMHNAGVYMLDDVRHVVLDEADTLLDDSFHCDLTDFLLQLKLRSRFDEKGAQLTLVSATMPTSLPEILGNLIQIEYLRKITTSELHTILPHVRHRFIRALKSTKPAFLLKIVKEAYAQKSPIIVFCNHADTCTWVSDLLKGSGVGNINLSGSMLLSERKNKFKAFQSGVENVLVCTSVASRGLDTKHVKHVLNYEFPSFIVEYIHRSGRTGRLGSDISGRVTNLISGKNEVQLVQKIEIAVRSNIPFENVNANIQRIIKFHRAAPEERKLGIA